MLDRVCRSSGPEPERQLARGGAEERGVGGGRGPELHVCGLREGRVGPLLGAVSLQKGIHGLVAEAEGRQAAEAAWRAGDLHTGPLGGHHRLPRGQPGRHPGEDAQVLIRGEHGVVDS